MKSYLAHLKDTKLKLPSNIFFLFLGENIQDLMIPRSNPGKEKETEFASWVDKYQGRSDDGYGSGDGSGDGYNDRYYE